LNAEIVTGGTMGVPITQLDNPSVTFNKNGSLIMAARGGNPHKQCCSDGIVTAPSWRGPYTQHTQIGTPSSPDVEDPFIYTDAHGHYHCLFHKFVDEHPSCGGHAFSRDGWTWTLTNSPAYTSIVNTTDGGSHNFNRRERPHLLFDDNGTTPVMLFTSLTNWNFTVFGTDKAFTFGQRIGP
jgi:hypothetical protein